MNFTFHNLDTSLKNIRTEEIVNRVISNNRFIRKKLAIDNKVSKEDFRKFISIYKICTNGYMEFGVVSVTELFYLFSLDGIYYTNDNKIDKNINGNNYLIRHSPSEPNKLTFVHYNKIKKERERIFIFVNRESNFIFKGYSGYEQRGITLSDLILNKMKIIFGNIEPYILPNYWPNENKENEQNAGYFNKYLKYKMKYLLLKYN